MKLTFRTTALLAAILSVGLALCCRHTTVPSPLGPEPRAAAAPAPATPPDRPADWATPLDHPGLPNLHRVDDHLYRGAQPTGDGFRELKALGVRTVINLRNFHSERHAASQAGLALEEIPLTPAHITEEDALRFLRVVADKSRGPFFVHCQHGADRTGTMMAVYRVVVCDWSKAEALDEMVNGGFGFHVVWENLPKFIESLDVEKLRRAAGIRPPASGPSVEPPPPPTPGTPLS